MPYRTESTGRWRRIAGLSAGAICLLAGLASCSGVGEKLGFGKQSPDEFAVVRNAPLTVPPDFALRPPQPGAPRPQEAAISDQAEATVFRGEEGAGSAAAANRPGSPGEHALLQEANATNTDPDIRRLVDREFSIYAQEQEGFFESMLFWRGEEEFGTVVDPEAEAQRLRENAALGRAPTEGETPVIERREKALLEGIF